ncbi:MAG TPA: STAS domain-containing protein [Burkholderiaceae bacterium]|jgi:phospholipid transport system transporter-binding protein|nr:STAS domain-containing protein [Burkholderiaceae bacterium]
MRIDADDMSLANASQLAGLGIAAVQAGDTSFDLSAVRTCDSSALVVLLAWQRAAIAAGRSIEVSGVPADMLSLATVYGVDSLLPISDAARP